MIFRNILKNLVLGYQESKNEQSPINVGECPIVGVTNEVLDDIDVHEHLYYHPQQELDKAEAEHYSLIKEMDALQPSVETYKKNLSKLGSLNDKLLALKSIDPNGHNFNIQLEIDSIEEKIMFFEVYKKENEYILDMMQKYEVKKNNSQDLLRKIEFLVNTYPKKKEVPEVTDPWADLV